MIDLNALRSSELSQHFAAKHEVWTELDQVGFVNAVMSILARLNETQ
jgi:hypothetical protein